MNFFNVLELYKLPGFAIIFILCNLFTEIQCIFNNSLLNFVYLFFGVISFSFFCCCQVQCFNQWFYPYDIAFLKQILHII